MVGSKVREKLDALYGDDPAYIKLRDAQDKALSAFETGLASGGSWKELNEKRKAANREAMSVFEKEMDSRRAEQKKPNKHTGSASPAGLTAEVGTKAEKKAVAGKPTVRKGKRKKNQPVALVSKPQVTGTNIAPVAQKKPSVTNASATQTDESLAARIKTYQQYENGNQPWKPFEAKSEGQKATGQGGQAGGSDIKSDKKTPKFKPISQADLDLWGKAQQDDEEDRDWARKLNGLNFGGAESSDSQRAASKGTLAGAGVLKDEAKLKGQGKGTEGESGAKGTLTTQGGSLVGAEGQGKEAEGKDGISGSLTITSGDKTTSINLKGKKQPERMIVIRDGKLVSVDPAKETLSYYEAKSSSDGTAPFMVLLPPATSKMSEAGKMYAPNPKNADGEILAEIPRKGNVFTNVGLGVAGGAAAVASDLMHGAGLFTGAQFFREGGKYYQGLSDQLMSETDKNSLAAQIGFAAPGIAEAMWLLASPECFDLGACVLALQAGGRTRQQVLDAGGTEAQADAAGLKAEAVSIFSTALYMGLPYIAPSSVRLDYLPLLTEKGAKAAAGVVIGSGVRSAAIAGVAGSIRQAGNQAAIESSLSADKGFFKSFASAWLDHPFDVGGAIVGGAIGSVSSLAQIGREFHISRGPGWISVNRSFKFGQRMRVGVGKYSVPAAESGGFVKGRGFVRVFGKATTPNKLLIKDRDGTHVVDLRSWRAPTGQGAFWETFRGVGSKGSIINLTPDGSARSASGSGSEAAASNQGNPPATTEAFVPANGRIYADNQLSYLAKEIFPRAVPIPTAPTAVLGATPDGRVILATPNMAAIRNPLLTSDITAVNLAKLDIDGLAKFEKGFRDNIKAQSGESWDEFVRIADSFAPKVTKELLSSRENFGKAVKQHLGANHTEQLEATLFNYYTLPNVSLVPAQSFDPAFHQEIFNATGMEWPEFSQLAKGFYDHCEGGEKLPADLEEFGKALSEYTGSETTGATRTPLRDALFDYYYGDGAVKAYAENEALVSSMAAKVQQKAAGFGIDVQPRAQVAVRPQQSEAVKAPDTATAESLAVQAGYKDGFGTRIAEGMIKAVQNDQTCLTNADKFHERFKSVSMCTEEDLAKPKLAALEREVLRLCRGAVTIKPLNEGLSASDVRVSPATVRINGATPDTSALLDYDIQSDGQLTRIGQGDLPVIASEGSGVSYADKGRLPSVGKLFTSSVREHGGKNTAGSAVAVIDQVLEAISVKPKSVTTRVEGTLADPSRIQDYDIMPGERLGNNAVEATAEGRGESYVEAGNMGTLGEAIQSALTALEQAKEEASASAVSDGWKTLSHAVVSDPSILSQRGAFDKLVDTTFGVQPVSVKESLRQVIVQEFTESMMSSLSAAQRQAASYVVSSEYGKNVLYYITEASKSGVTIDKALEVAQEARKIVLESQQTAATVTGETAANLSEVPAEQNAPSVVQQEPVVIPEMPSTKNTELKAAWQAAERQMKQWSQDSDPLKRELASVVLKRVYTETDPNRVDGITDSAVEIFKKGDSEVQTRLDQWRSLWDIEPEKSAKTVVEPARGDTVSEPAGEPARVEPKYKGPVDNGPVTERDKNTLSRCIWLAQNRHNEIGTTSPLSCRISQVRAMLSNWSDDKFDKALIALSDKQRITLQEEPDGDLTEAQKAGGFYFKRLGQTFYDVTAEENIQRDYDEPALPNATTADYVPNRASVQSEHKAPTVLAERIPVSSQRPSLKASAEKSEGISAVSAESVTVEKAVEKAAEQAGVKLSEEGKQALTATLKVGETMVKAEVNEAIIKQTSTTDVDSLFAVKASKAIMEACETAGLSPVEGFAVFQEAWNLMLTGSFTGKGGVDRLSTALAEKLGKPVDRNLCKQLHASIRSRKEFKSKVAALDKAVAKVEKGQPPAEVVKQVSNQITAEEVKPTVPEKLMDAGTAAGMSEEQINQAYGLVSDIAAARVYAGEGSQKAFTTDLKKAGETAGITVSDKFAVSAYGYARAKLWTKESIAAAQQAAQEIKAGAKARVSVDAVLKAVDKAAESAKKDVAVAKAESAVLSAYKTAALDEEEAKLVQFYVSRALNGSKLTGDALARKIAQQRDAEIANLQYLKSNVVDSAIQKQIEGLLDKSFAGVSIDPEELTLARVECRQELILSHKSGNGLFEISRAYIRKLTGEVDASVQQEPRDSAWYRENVYGKGLSQESFEFHENAIKAALTAAKLSDPAEALARAAKIRDERAASIMYAQEQFAPWQEDLIEDLVGKLTKGEYPESPDNLSALKTAARKELILKYKRFQAKKLTLSDVTLSKAEVIKLKKGLKLPKVEKPAVQPAVQPVVKQEAQPEVQPVVQQEPQSEQKSAVTAVSTSDGRSQTKAYWMTRPIDRKFIKRELLNLCGRQQQVEQWDEQCWQAAEQKGLKGAELEAEYARALDKLAAKYRYEDEEYEGKALTPEQIALVEKTVDRAVENQPLLWDSWISERIDVRSDIIEIVKQSKVSNPDIAGKLDEIVLGEKERILSDVCSVMGMDFEQLTNEVYTGYSDDKVWAIEDKISAKLIRENISSEKEYRQRACELRSSYAADSFYEAKGIADKGDRSRIESAIDRIVKDLNLDPEAEPEGILVLRGWLRKALYEQQKADKPLSLSTETLNEFLDDLEDGEGDYGFTLRREDSQQEAQPEVQANLVKAANTGTSAQTETLNNPAKAAGAQPEAQVELPVTKPQSTKASAVPSKVILQRGEEAGYNAEEATRIYNFGLEVVTAKGFTTGKGALDAFKLDLAKKYGKEVSANFAKSVYLGVIKKRSKDTLTDTAEKLESVSGAAASKDVVVAAITALSSGTPNTEAVVTRTDVQPNQTLDRKPTQSILDNGKAAGYNEDQISQLYGHGSAIVSDKGFEDGKGVFKRFEAELSKRFGSPVPAKYANSIYISVKNKLRGQKIDSAKNQLTKGSGAAASLDVVTSLSTQLDEGKSPKAADSVERLMKSVPFLPSASKADVARVKTAVAEALKQKGSMSKTELYNIVDEAEMNISDERNAEVSLVPPRVECMTCEEYVDYMTQDAIDTAEKARLGASARVEYFIAKEKIYDRVRPAHRSLIEEAVEKTVGSDITAVRSNTRAFLIRKYEHNLPLSLSDKEIEALKAGRQPDVQTEAMKKPDVKKPVAYKPLEASTKNAPTKTPVKVNLPDVGDVLEGDKWLTVDMSAGTTEDQWVSAYLDKTQGMKAYEAYSEQEKLSRAHEVNLIKARLGKAYRVNKSYAKNGVPAKDRSGIEASVSKCLSKLKADRSTEAFAEGDIREALIQKYKAGENLSLSEEELRNMRSLRDYFNALDLRNRLRGSAEPQAVKAVKRSVVVNLADLPADVKGLYDKAKLPDGLRSLIERRLESRKFSASNYELNELRRDAVDAMKRGKYFGQDLSAEEKKLLSEYQSKQPNQEFKAPVQEKPVPEVQSEAVTPAGAIDSEMQRLTSQLRVDAKNSHIKKFKAACTEICGNGSSAVTKEEAVTGLKNALQDFHIANAKTTDMEAKAKAVQAAVADVKAILSKAAMSDLDVFRAFGSDKAAVVKRSVNRMADSLGAEVTDPRVKLYRGLLIHTMETVGGTNAVSAGSTAVAGSTASMAQKSQSPEVSAEPAAETLVQSDTATGGAEERSKEIPMMDIGGNGEITAEIAEIDRATARAKKAGRPVTELAKERADKVQAVYMKHYKVFKAARPELDAIRDRIVKAVSEAGYDMDLDAKKKDQEKLVNRYGFLNMTLLEDLLKKNPRLKDRVSADIEAYKNSTFMRKRGEIAEAMYGLMRNMAAKNGVFNDPGEISDMTSAGMSYLLNTMDWYDPENPEKGKFTTFVGWRAKAGIKEYVERKGIRYEDYKVLKKIRQFRDDYAAEHNGKKPTDEELIKGTGLTEKRIKTVMEKASIKLYQDSIDREISDSEGNTSNVGDFVEDKSTDLEASAISAEEKAKLTELMEYPYLGFVGFDSKSKSMTPAQRRAVEAMLGSAGRTQTEIATELGITKESFNDSFNHGWERLRREQGMRDMASRGKVLNEEERRFFNYMTKKKPDGTYPTYKDAVVKFPDYVKDADSAEYKHLLIRGKLYEHYDPFEAAVDRWNANNADKLKSGKMSYSELSEKRRAEAVKKRDAAVKKAIVEFTKKEKRPPSVLELLSLPAGSITPKAVSVSLRSQLGALEKQAEAEGRQLTDSEAAKLLGLEGPEDIRYLRTHRVSHKRSDVRMASRPRTLEDYGRLLWPVSTA